MFYKKFHWTFHVQSLASTAYPLLYLFYNTLHNSYIYERYFIKQSKVQFDDDFFHQMENQISAVSDLRLRPISNAKLAIIAEDKLESEVIGSFGLTPGVLFKFSSRLAIKDVEDFCQKFPNINDLISFTENFVDSSKIPKNLLNSVILSDNAKNFLLNRSVHEADSIGQVLMPAILHIIIFSSFYPVLSFLKKFISQPLSLGFVLTMSTFCSYFIIKFYLAQRTKHFDYLVLTSNDKALLNGCEEYLKKSIELGKLLRSLNQSNTKIKKIFDENGDCLSHSVKYSTRLKLVESYIENKRIQNEKIEKEEKLKSSSKLKTKFSQTNAV